MARPKGVRTKLTPDVKDSIVKAIKAGLTQKLVAQSVGIGYSTLRKWISDSKKPGASKVLRGFYSDIKKAEAERIQECLEEIKKAGKKSWQAYAWILERTRPDLFALSQKEIRELLKELRGERRSRQHQLRDSSPIAGEE